MVHMPGVFVDSQLSFCRPVVQILKRRYKDSRREKHDHAPLRPHSKQRTIVTRSYPAGMAQSIVDSGAHQSLRRCNWYRIRLRLAVTSTAQQCRSAGAPVERSTERSESSYPHRRPVRDDSSTHMRTHHRIRWGIRTRRMRLSLAFLCSTRC